MSRLGTMIRPIVVLLGWALIVSIASIVPVTSVAAQTLDTTSRLAADTAIDAPLGLRTSSRADAPSQVLAFRFDPPADCLYDNSCPEQVGNGDDDAPPPRDAEADARESRDDALDKIADEFEAPNFIVYPGYAAQMVNLESFLHIEDGWETKSVTGKDVGGQRVTVLATPLRSVWEFTDNRETVEVVCTETEPWTEGDTEPLCGKDWEHASSVIGTVNLRVTIEYQLQWDHAHTSGSQVSSEDDRKWSVDRELTVREALTRGVTEELPYEPEPDVIPEVAKPDTVECGWGAKFAAALIPGLGCEPIQLVYDLFTGFLGNCVGAIIGRIGDLWDTIKSVASDPVGFLKDQVAGLKEMFDLLLEDPLALLEQLGREFFELEADDDPTTWDAGQWADWAGKFICAKAFDYLSGQASGRLMRYLDGKIRPNGPNGPSNNPDLDPDGNNGDPDGNDGDNGDPDAPTCTRNSSFPTGTQVVMDDGGLRAINNIRPGDRVLSYNVDTSVWEPKLVLDQWSYDDRGPPATATLVDGSTVTATHDHRFYTPATGEWVELQHLRTGDSVLSPDGPVVLGHVTVGPAHPWTVWELTVADNHNFTVLASDTPILVHNCGHEPPDGYDGRSFEQLLPEGKIPTDSSTPPFADWFNRLSPEELAYLMEDGTLAKKIKDTIREGGNHEWCMCAEVQKFKDWGLTMEQIRQFVTPTADTRGSRTPTQAPDGTPYTGDWVGEPWRHPTSGVWNSSASKAFHNELQNIIQNAPNLDGYLEALPGLLDRWGVDPNVLPPFPHAS